MKGPRKTFQTGGQLIDFAHMTQGDQVLRHILKLAEASSDPFLFVFDLDSTLFDVSPRIQKIIHNFAEAPENRALFPAQVEILKKIELQKSDWGIKTCLIRAGLDQQHPDFYEAVRKYWFKHFFSNEYLKYDVPYEGAVEFVQKLAQTHHDIAYLTGRDQHRMGIGSRETLIDAGFPLDDKRARLVLKPHQSQIDHDFKKNWFLDLPKNAYTGIWFFENEPINIELVQNEAPHVNVVFFDSTHSGRAASPTNLPRIMHYLMDDKAD